MKKRGYCFRSKHAQMKISFGMIWAIILIIAFMGFAFYAVQKFLGMQRNLEVGNFANSLQEDIDRFWKSQKNSKQINYSLPTRIEKVCFIDYYSPLGGRDKEIGENLKQLFYEYENVFFYPIGSAEGLDAMQIKHLDIETITSEKNPNCFDNTGKIELVIKKDYNNPLVVIE